MATCSESYLRNHGIETLVMAGVASNGAVLATALEALSRDLFTIVVRDATIGTTEDLHIASLKSSARKISSTARSVCDIWQKKKKNNKWADTALAWTSAGPKSPPRLN